MNLEPSICPDCGAELPTASPDGLCPACLLRVGVSEERSDDTPSSKIPSEHSGDRIGRYKLLDKIGEGGFGDVWMAEQKDPVRRKVALKVIKLGMDTRDVVARFEAERQALAMMDHPNIARVFDGGATDSGRPYFVMELVRGLPITEFCDARRMPPSERLELFRKVCLAIQHAHQKGIIHRDLKPSNILVTVQDDEAVPKIIDFGVAKALQAQLTEKTLFTRFNQWIGTPSYMSPEQAGLGGLDVDTRSDIYSLGAVLYELLTGCQPLDERELRRQGYDSVLAAIRESDPPKPSTRITTLPPLDLEKVAMRRGQKPKKLEHAVRGQLDWILLKALERDRNRRYQSANNLALDLQNFLNNEPISAAGPNLAYLLSRLIIRHWPRVAFVGVLLLSILLLSSYLRFRSETQQIIRDLPQQIMDDLRSPGPSPAQLEEDAALALPRLREINDGSITSIGCSSSSTQQLAVLTKTGTVRIIDPFGDKTVQSAPLDQMITCLSFSPDGTTLLAGTNLGDLRTLDPRNGTSSLVTSIPERSIGRVAWLGNDRIAGGGFQRYWQDGNPVNHDIPAGYVMSYEPSEVLWSFRGLIRRTYNTLAANRDGSVLAVLDIPGKPRGVSLLDGDTGKIIKTLHDAEHSSGPLSAAFSPDGRILAVGYAPMDIILWNTDSGERIALLEGHTNWVVSLAFSEDGQQLISGGGDSSARVWDIAERCETGRLRFDGNSTYVESVGFLRNDDTIYAMVDGLIVIARAQTHF